LESKWKGEYAPTIKADLQRPDEPLDSWLFPPGTEDADIYAIAFQEIVQLNAQQILQTDPAKR
jgi:hypothetical protein